jgi:hypothetical protein
VVTSLQAFWPTWELHSPSHHPSLLRNMRLYITQFQPASCYLLSPEPKYSLQHPVFKHPQSIFPINMRNKVTHRYKTTCIAVLCMLTLCLKKQTKRQDILKWMVVNIDWI